MDSLPGEDLTLPLGFSGSVNISQFPDVSGDEIRIQLGGGGVLPDVAEETISPSRVRTMKDFETQITELRKENFNLKLRIYFLEEHMQQKFDGPNEDICRVNIELKVELESLKRELQERERLLVKASKAVESLAQGGDAEVQALKEEMQKKAQQVECLASRMKILEEDLRVAQEETGKALAVTEQERVLRLAAERQLSLRASVPPKEAEVLTALEEKDRRIEQLNLSLTSKEAVIQRLEEAASQRRSVEETLVAEKIQEHTAALMREKEKELEVLRAEFGSERNDFEKRVQSLQEELHQQQLEFSVEKRNALKRDKTIQGLTLALKTKEKENEELSSEIEGLNASLIKCREAVHTAQMQKFRGVEDSQALLREKESILADLHSENLNKDTENLRLQKKIKSAEQELHDLRLEREKLMKELEEAQLQNNRSDKTINDLRNQLEKTHDGMAEKEKATEHHYGLLLSESNQKLQSQELVITRLMDNVAQKDELLQNLDGVVRRKDVELQEWCAKFHSLLKNQELLQQQNEDLLQEKRVDHSQQLVAETVQELQKKRESEYRDLIEALKQQHNMFSALIKSLKDADGKHSLQEELNHIFLLRKQLEDDILANWNLRKVLEDQIKANRREEESVSSWSDQTSYMSICLREQNCVDVQIDHLSHEELKKKVVELCTVVKELHVANQELSKKLFEFSALDPLAKERWKALESSELLERAEENRTLTDAFEEEMSVPSRPCPETVTEVIPSDYLDRQCKNLNKSVFEHEAAVEKCCGGNTVGENGEAQEEGSVVSLLNRNGAAAPGSRQEQMKIANRLLDHLNAIGGDSSGDDLENKDEKALKQLILQLRADLGKALQHPVTSKSTLVEKEGPDSEPAVQIKAETEASKGSVKDTATQTVAGNATRLKPEGPSVATEDQAKSARLSGRRHPKRACVKGQEQESLRHTSKTYKSDPCYQFRKSRLPIPLKSSRSAGSTSFGGALQKTDQHLQHRVFTLDEGLKGRRLQPEPLSDELLPSKPETGRPDREGADSFIQLDSSEMDSSLLTVESKGETEQDRSTSQGTSPLAESMKLDGSEVEISLIGVESEGETGKGQNTSQETDTHTLEAGRNQGSDFPEKQGADAASLYSASKSLLSLRLSGTSTHALDSEAVLSADDLRAHIKALKSKLEEYETLLSQFEPAKEGPAAEVALGEAETKEPTLGGRLLSPAASVLQRPAESQIHAQDPVSPAPELGREETVHRLKELLSENEAELEREQIANMQLLDKVCRLQSKLRSVPPEWLDSPVHSTMREDSFLRQQIQEGHSICATYRQHLTNLIRAFEELLQASEVEYYAAESFRELLNRSAQLFERLEQQCLYGESIDEDMTKLHGLTHNLSNFELSQKSSSVELPGHKTEQLEGEPERLEDVPAKFPEELLMEHLQEIGRLRHQLEESIRTNDRLRKQLEQQGPGAPLDRGSASVCVCASEQHNSLTSEIHFLRKQNQALNVMLAKGSRDKQKENEKLRESLSRKDLALQSLQKDLECLGKENEKLQKQVKKREDENGHLSQEVHNARNELNRLQAEVDAKQHQLSENDRLLRSLRLELTVFEKLDETLRSQKDHRSDERWKDQTHPLGLHGLLTEMQNLRTQLERSIKANKILHEKLEEQLSRGKRERAALGSTRNIQYLLDPEWEHFRGGNELKFCSTDGGVLELQPKQECDTEALKADAELALDNADGCSRGSSSASKSDESFPVASHFVWADKNGRHILGLIEDYNSLQKQISEGQKWLSELQLLLKDAETQGPGVMKCMATAGGDPLAEGLRNGPSLERHRRTNWWLDLSRLWWWWWWGASRPPVWLPSPAGGVDGSPLLPYTSQKARGAEGPIILLQRLLPKPSRKHSLPFFRGSGGRIGPGSCRSSVASLHLSSSVSFSAGRTSLSLSPPPVSHLPSLGSVLLLPHPSNSSSWQLFPFVSPLPAQENILHCPPIVGFPLNGAV
ncbi:CDK5 regulatory subunit-associated protein 2 isoform X2 [Varanus komodoensis]|uniref:CDK5 regulatory subunit-associated protein 2 isoform X2 n=1 Tax=Varanus komodoensis TaxID=61221 RepID=UPI001CF7CB22|nr:CDK5 regulatory subunit-associated protein 2 isoform X2 [Varanus komodoensis]